MGHARVAGPAKKGEAQEEAKREGILMAPRAAPGARRRANFFRDFFGPASARTPALRLIDWNRYNFFDDPLCDDLLTMGVDNSDGWGL